MIHLRFNKIRSFQPNPFPNLSKSSSSIPIPAHWVPHSGCDEQIDAHKVFDEMLERNFKSWNAKIRDSNPEESLSLFHQMQCTSLRPDHDACAALLKSCAALSAIEFGKALHGSVIKSGYDAIRGVHNAAMNMYAKCGALRDSSQLFDEMGHRRDPVSWNILLSGYAQSKSYIEVANLIRLMHSCDEQPKPNEITVVIVLPLCARFRDLRSGKTVHAYAVKTGLDLHTLVANSILSMYAKCGCVSGDARTVFRGIVCKDVVSWNAMIAGYAENGFLAESFRSFRRMLSDGVKPNHATIANVLPVCAFLEDGYHGKDIHCHVLRSALDGDVSICNALITFYSRIGNMEEAESVFRKMHSKDLVSWNTVIAGYAMNGWPRKALELFRELLSTRMEPDSITLISVLPVYTELRDVQEGRKIHEYILRRPELREDTAVGNALISFYAKCGKLEDAFQVFASIPRRDLVSWNAMLATYADRGDGGKLVDLLNHMQKKGFRPDSVTILSILRACAVFGLGKVKEAHGYSIRAGLLTKLAVGNTILDSYAKCGSMEHAFKTFESLSGKNVITGNAMISGYTKHGCHDDAEAVFSQMRQKDLTTWNLMVQVYSRNDCADQALSLFHELQNQGMRPDVVSIMNILPVCASLASVRLVKQCHAYVTRAQFYDVCLEGALLDIYSKCGSVNDAQKLFWASTQKDLLTFTAMVGGFAIHGLGEEALVVFSQMLELDIKPDHVIMTAVLSACSHAGLLDEGWNHFQSMNDVHGIEPTMEHYACMVDLLARGGHLKDAYAFISKMPVEANANVWGTLLGACKIHHEVELGRVVANHLFDVEASNIGNYVVLSNIYAADGRWEGVEEVRRLMRTRDLRKPAGCSWIEVERRRHVFLAADSSHPERTIIYNMLRTLDRQIKELLV